MRITVWLATLVVIGLSVTGLFSYKSSLTAARAAAGGGEPVATVAALRATARPYQARLTVSGETKALQAVQLINELGGRITKLNFASGAVVAQGQVLLELDHSEEQARLRAAQARRALYNKRLKRYASLRTNAGISDEDVDQAAADLRVAQAEIAALQSVIAKKVLRAPFAARAGIHDLQVGQYLPINSAITHLVGLQDASWVDFHVPQIYAELPLGTPVSITVGDGASAALAAEVVSVEPVLSRGSRQFRYRARVPDAGGRLKHQRLVQVTLPVAAPQMKVAIPSLAVAKDPTGDYVFVLKQEQGVYRAHRQRLQLGERIGDHVIVQAGLEAGAYIAHQGAFKLRPGMQVQIAPATTPATTKAPDDAQPNV